MTSFLNQIFYNCNKFDTIDCIKSLEKYMHISKDHYRRDTPPFTEEINETTPLLSENMELFIDINEPSVLPATLPSVLPATLPTALPDNNNNLYYPQKKNSLFWCVFISCYGYNEYHLIGNRFSNKELEVKQDMIRYFTENPKHLKNSNHKVTNGLIQEISAELMINKKSSLLECIAFSIFFKKHLYIVNNNTYLTFTFGNMIDSEMTSDNVVIINYDSSEKNQNTDSLQKPKQSKCYNKNINEYGIDLEPTIEKIESIRQEKVLLEHYEKPLKGMSTYKVYELEDMARKLQMISTVSLNKTELYKAVWDTMMW